MGARIFYYLLLNFGRIIISLSSFVRVLYIQKENCNRILDLLITCLLKVLKQKLFQPFSRGIIETCFSVLWESHYKGTYMFVCTYKLHVLITLFPVFIS